MNVEADFDAIERAARAAHKDVIRSHGWNGMVKECCLLDVDEEYLLAADPAVVLELMCRLRAAESDAAHWKANHDAQVQRARVLIERPDMPLERVQAYRRYTEIEQERDALRDMLDDARLRLDMLREALGVAFEPHQSLIDRMHEAARGASATPRTGGTQ